MGTMMNSLVSSKRPSHRKRMKTASRFMWALTSSAQVHVQSTRNSLEAAINSVRTRTYNLLGSSLQGAKKAPRLWKRGASVDNSRAAKGCQNPGLVFLIALRRFSPVDRARSECDQNKAK